MPPLGFFRVERFNGYTAKNPKTGMEFSVPPSVSLSFLPSARLTLLLDGRSAPSEVTHEEFSSLLAAFELQSPSQVWSKLREFGVTEGGLSEQQILELEGLQSRLFPNFVATWLATCSVQSPPFNLEGSECLHPETVNEILNQFGEAGGTTPSGIPFCRLGCGDLAWYFCCCEQCSEDPQVYVGQSAEAGHTSGDSRMLFSEWLIDRLLVKQVKEEFSGRVLRPEDSITLMNRLAKLDTMEGLPSMPI